MNEDILPYQFTDSHNHFQEIRRPNFNARVVQMVANGTAPSDWDSVIELAKADPRVVPAVGLHPWRLSEDYPGWLPCLREHLATNRRATIGEVGLDRSRRSSPLDQQLPVFQAQLSLAAEFNRTISIHCVHRWGTLLASLQSIETPPPRTVVHDFRGPTELIPDLTNLSVCFSVGSSGVKDPTLLRAIPMDSLLFESDASATNGRQPDDVAAVFSAAATVLNVGLPSLVARVHSNFSRVFLE